MSAFVSCAGWGTPSHRVDAWRCARQAARFRCARRALVRAEDKSASSDAESDKVLPDGDAVVQERLVRALRKSVQEMKQSKAGGTSDEGIERVADMGKQEIEELAQDIMRNLESVRDSDGMKAIYTASDERLEAMVKSFDERRQTLEDTIERERDLVLTEAERIRELTEELASARGSSRADGGEKLRPTVAIVALIGWVCGLSAMYYLYLGLDSGYIFDGLANAGVNGAVALLSFFLYQRMRQNA